ncbi:MAG: transcription antitermination factor NusB, partial [Brumimicrobium sp.]|nr:transcription antitermination factor NusB [Brumimicrobium sp.]
MLNRRHLRIKVLQALYAFFQSDRKDLLSSEKELFGAIEKIYDLYISLLLTFSELKTKGEHRIEENKKKMLPTDEDLNPNRKFVDNAISEILENHNELRRISEERKVNWIGAAEQEIFRKMYFHIRESETYFEFMNNEQTGFEEDKAFLIELFKTEIANFQPLYDYYEEKSIHWLDDIDLACAMVIKTLKTFTPEGPNVILPLYKPDDDEKEFVRDLFRQTIKMKEDNLILIDDLTQNWELDRIAKMDMILMEMAITELQTFSNIPKKVTLN